MSKEQMEKLIIVLIDKIDRLETEKFLKDIEIENSKKEIARLQELLTPTRKIKKDGKEDEE